MITEGGLLGVLLNLLYLLAVNLIGGHLVDDVVGTAVVVPPAKPVPGPGTPELAMPGMLLAIVGAIAVARRRNQRRQASGR